MSSDVLPFFLLSLSYGLCYLQVLIALPGWTKAALKGASVFALVASLTSALILSRIEIEGVLFAFLLSLGWLLHKRQTGNVLFLGLSLLLGALCAALMLHLLPGFNKLLVFKEMKFSDSSAPYTMYLNMDKALIAAYPLIFGFFIAPTQMRLRSKVETFLFVYLFLFVVLLGLGWASGYIIWDPKFPSEFWIWSLNNLFFVCASEEVLFRGFTFYTIQKLVPGAPASFRLAVSSLIFGLAHFQGGWVYVMLASVAGLGYGFLYEKNKNLLWPILIHYCINATHFIFFSYPFYDHR